MRTHCKHGHILSEKNIYTRPNGYKECKACRLEKKQRWTELHRSNIRKHSRRFFSKNREKVLEWNRKWSKENPAQVREISRRKYRRNPEKKLKKNYAWQKRNPRHYQTLQRMASRRYRARKLSQLGVISPTIEKDLALLQGGLCYYCKTDIKAGHHHLDHKTPLSRGGFHDNNNVCLTCPSCNLRKGARTESEFREEEEWTR